MRSYPFGRRFKSAEQKNLPNLAQEKEYARFRHEILLNGKVQRCISAAGKIQALVGAGAESLGFTT